jgi:excisionase family DNA binding protein
MESKIVTEFTPDELADVLALKIIALFQQQAPAAAIEIIDRSELCKRLNITEPTVIRMEKRGDLPVIRAGSSVRYNWPKVIEALEASDKKKRK